jgi:hypothetical protein
MKWNAKKETPVASGRFMGVVSHGACDNQLAYQPSAEARTRRLRRKRFTDVARFVGAMTLLSVIAITILVWIEHTERIEGDRNAVASSRVVTPSGANRNVGEVRRESALLGTSPISSVGGQVFPSKPVRAFQNQTTVGAKGPSSEKHEAVADPEAERLVKPRFQTK